MTIVEAVLALSTLWGMYRKSQAVAAPGDTTVAPSIADLESATCAMPPTAFAAVNPTLVAPGPTVGNALPLTTLPPAPELPEDAVYVQDLLQTPTVTQQLWTSPTRGRFIVTIGMVGDLKQITVTPDIPMPPTYGDDIRLPVLIEPIPYGGDVLPAPGLIEPNATIIHGASSGVFSPML
jgi:hypothetical protein